MFVFYTSWFSICSLQVLCQLPVRQTVFQPVPGHAGSRGDGEEQPAPAARPQGDERHQHGGGEPPRPGESLFSAGLGREGPRHQTQSGTHLLQGKSGMFSSQCFGSFFIISLFLDYFRRDFYFSRYNKTQK